MPLKTLLISNIGTGGINTDLSPSELPPEFITFGINFHVHGNTISSSESNELWATAPVDFNGGHVRFVNGITSNSWLVAGRSAVYTYNGATWSDISSTVGYATIGADDELLWSSCMLGSIPIINNPQHVPEYWSPQDAGQIMQPLDFSPGVSWTAASKSFEVIRSHNNFLFALNLVEGGTSQPNSYRWSHPADINGLPFTWDETDASAIAGYEQILGDSGAIVDGITLRNSFCIYTERGINILDFTGDEFVFRNRELSTTYGLLNRNAIVEVEGVHYFLGDGDILKNDGNTVKSIAENRIRSRLSSQINAERFNRSFAVLNKAEKEIWFCVPEETADYPNTAYVYNWFDDAWSIKSLPDGITFADYGSVPEAPLTWATIQGTYESTPLKWGAQTGTPLNETVMGVSNASGTELVILNPLSTNGGGDTNARIERTDFPLEGHRNVTTLTQLIPHMTGSEDVSIQVGSQMYAGGPITWQPPCIFNPSNDRKIDVRSTGLLHAWRIDSVGTGSWAMSGMTFSYTNAGER